MVVFMILVLEKALIILVSGINIIYLRNNGVIRDLIFISRVSVRILKGFPFIVKSSKVFIAAILRIYILLRFRFNTFIGSGIGFQLRN